MTWDGRRRTAERQTGTVTASLTIAAASSGTVNVTFDEPFAAAPTYCNAIMSSFASGAGAVVVRQCDNVTASGFRIVLFNTSGASISFSGAVYSWVAIA